MQELKEHRILFSNELGFHNLGQEFVDTSDTVRRKEEDVHIQALQSVKDSSLRVVRDEIINVYKSGA